MSRTNNERSVPQERGRRQEKLVKRRASKRARRNEFESNPKVIKLCSKTEVLDRETKQADTGS